MVVGALSSGLVTFVSEGYGGSASDRQTIERSNLRQLMDPGDEIMAEKNI